MSLAIEYPDPQCSTALLLYCLSATLPPWHTAPLSQLPNVSLLCCPIAHSPLPHCYTALLFYYLTVPVPHCITVSLMHCTALPLHYPTVTQPHCLTFPLPHSLSASLSQCSFSSVHFPCPIASLCHTALLFTAFLSCYRSPLLPHSPASSIPMHWSSTSLFHCLTALRPHWVSIHCLPSPLIPISHCSIAQLFYCQTAYICVPDCSISSLLPCCLIVSMLQPPLPHCPAVHCSSASLPHCLPPHCFSH
jgi:hypothetical protein